MASNNKAQSGTLRAIGPSTHNDEKGCVAGPRGTTPGVGLRPTTPQKLAGIRKLPPKSDPLAPHTCPVATATLAPPDDPPQVLRVSHGFEVTPKTSLKVVPPAPNSGVFDFATIEAALDSRRSTV